MDEDRRKHRFSIIGLFLSMMTALGIVCYSVANDNSDSIYATRGLGIVNNSVNTSYICDGIEWPFYTDSELKNFPSNSDYYSFEDEGPLPISGSRISIGSWVNSWMLFKKEEDYARCIIMGDWLKPHSDAPCEKASGSFKITLLDDHTTDRVIVHATAFPNDSNGGNGLPNERKLIGVNGITQVTNDSTSNTIKFRAHTFDLPERTNELVIHNDQNIPSSAYGPRRVLIKKIIIRVY